MKTSPRLSLLALLCLTCLLAACQKSVPPPVMPLPDLRIAVAPFSQPVQTVQLLAGYIPEHQGMAAPEELLGLDNRFEELLTATGRSYIFLPKGAALGLLTQEGQSRRGALFYWTERAQAAGADLIIVPHVISWQQREGGPAGAMRPAAVAADFYLIDARAQGALLHRSHYDEEQQALAENLLTFGSFLQRKGRWVTAEDLCAEGMAKAIKEFGL